MRLLRLAAWIVGTLFVLVIVYVAISFIHLRLTTHRADRVLAAIRGWNLRETPGAEIVSFTDQYSSFRTIEGDCVQNCVIRLGFVARPNSWLLENERLMPVAHALGDRWVQFSFLFGIQNGRLEHVDLVQYLQLRNHQYRVYEINGWWRSDFCARNYHTSRPRLTGPRHGGKVLMLHYWKPTHEEWQAIFSANPNCLSALIPCTKFGEYVPFAWNIWLQDSERTKRGEQMTGYPWGDETEESVAGAQSAVMPKSEGHCRDGIDLSGKVR